MYCKTKQWIRNEQLFQHLKNANFIQPCCTILQVISMLLFKLVTFYYVELLSIH